MHFSPCHDEGDNYRIVVVRHKVLEIRLGEGDVSIGDMIFHRVNNHHRLSVPLPLRGCTPPQEKPPAIVCTSPCTGTSCCGSSAGGPDARSPCVSRK